MTLSNNETPVHTVVAKTVEAEPTLGASPLQFKETIISPQLRAEVATVDKDLVFHFFLNEPMPKPLYEDFWEKRFPLALDAEAQKFFRAGFPTLQASRVKEFEIDSWWFRAAGFGHYSIDQDAFIASFYDRLRTALQA